MDTTWHNTFIITLGKMFKIDQEIYICVGGCGVCECAYVNVGSGYIVTVY